MAATFQGSGLHVNLGGSGNVINIAGSGSTLETRDFVNAGTGNLVGLLGGAGYVVNANGSTVLTTGHTGFNVFGDNNIVGTTAGDSAGVSGGNNTVHAAAGSTAFVSGTHGQADTIIASNDTVGGATATGTATGVFVNEDASAIVHGTGNDVIVRVGGHAVVDDGQHGYTDEVPGQVVILTPGQAGLLNAAGIRTVEDIQAAVDQVFEQVLGRPARDQELSAYVHEISTGHGTFRLPPRRQLLRRRVGLSPGRRLRRHSGYDMFKNGLIPK